MPSQILEQKILQKGHILKIERAGADGNKMQRTFLVMYAVNGKNEGSLGFLGNISQDDCIRLYEMINSAEDFRLIQRVENSESHRGQYYSK